MDWLRKKTDEWGKKRNVDIELDFPADWKTKIAALVEAGDPPDIVHIENVTWGPQFAEFEPTRQLLELDDVFRELDVSDLDPVVLEGLSIEDKKYFAGTWHSPNVLMWRNDIFTEVGYPERPDTWAETFEAMKKIKNKYPDLFPFGMQMGTFDQHNWMTMMWSFGAGVMKSREYPDGLIFNSEETRQFLQFIKDCWDAKLIPPDAPTWKAPTNNDAYASGKCAVIINAPSPYYQIVTNEVKDLYFPNTMMLAPPRGPNGYNQANMNISTFYIFDTCEHPDLAKDYIISILKDKEGLYNEAVIPTFGHVFPAWKSLWEKLKNEKDRPGAPAGYWKTYSDSLTPPKGKGVSNWPLGQCSIVFNEVSAKNVIVDMMQDACIGGMTVDQAVEKANGRIEDLFKTYYG